MYVPKPGTLFTSLKGTISEDAYIVYVSKDSDNRHELTIKYPSGQTVSLSSVNTTYERQVGAFVPKGSTISGTGAVGFYVVPASSVGG